METEKQAFELKVDELVQKRHLTDDEKRFLKARKEYIDPKVFDSLDLDTPKGTKDEPEALVNLENNQAIQFDFSKLTEDEMKEFAAANNIFLGKAESRDEVKAVLEGAVATGKIGKDEELEVDIDALTLPELKKLAKDQDLSLGGATTKDDIKEAILKGIEEKR